MSGEIIVFIILGTIAVASAAGMLLSRNAVYSAVFLILNFAILAIFYLLLGAPFIAMVQVTVYAGAIMVLFMFVVMLLGAERLTGPTGTSIGYMIVAGVLLVGLIGTSVYAISRALTLTAGQTGLAELLGSVEAAQEFGSPASVGTALFSQYVLPFEVVALLLLVAMIGAVVLTQDKKKAIDINAMQRERREAQAKAILEKQLQTYQATHSTNGDGDKADAPADAPRPAEASE